MKRLIAACILFIVLIAGCILEYQAVLRTTTHLVDTLGAASDLNSLYISQDQWKKYKPFLGGVLRHNEIDQIENLYHRAIQAAKNEDANEARLHMAELTGVLHHLSEMEFPSLHNIF